MHARWIQLVATMLLAVQALGAALPAGLAACACMPVSHALGRASSAQNDDSTSASTGDDDGNDDRKDADDAEACCCCCGCCGSKHAESTHDSGLPGSTSPHPKNQQDHQGDCGGCAAVNTPVESTVSIVIDQAMQHVLSMAAAPAADAPMVERDLAPFTPKRPPPRPPSTPAAALVLSSTRLII
jgi:hypothetical protein